MVTEPVRPLEVQLNQDDKSDLAISWGLHQITVGVFEMIIITLTKLFLCVFTDDNSLYWRLLKTWDS